MFGRRLFSREIINNNQFYKRFLSSHNNRHGTTILCVRKNDKVVMVGDGQVTQGSVVIKPNVQKVRRIGNGILVGFAGSTADALTLVERLEEKLSKHPEQLTRACVELAKAWRTDRYLRRLEAVLLVADEKNTFELSGNGDVLEPHHGVMAVGSGGSFAQAAAMALIDIEEFDAETIARKAMKIAGDMCVYTNHNLTLEILDKSKPKETTTLTSATTTPSLPITSSPSSPSS